VFTARNRQNPFAKRRRAQQAEAEAAEPAPESSTEPPAPKPVQMASGGVVEPPADETAYLLSSEANAERLREAVADIDAGRNLVEFPPTEEETTQANVVLDVPPISAETRAKIDEIVNRAVPPVAEPAEAWAAPDPAEIDAQVTRHETVEPEPTPEAETAAILADPDAMEAIAEAEAEPLTLDTLIETMPMEQGRAPIAEPETPPEDEQPKRGRGRPRPVETIVRDGKVFDLLKAANPEEGISKEALAIKLVEKEQQVYSSLRQLSKEGRAETRYVKGHGDRWFAVSPAETA
jgi:hypothetical protein